MARDEEERREECDCSVAWSLCGKETSDLSLGVRKDPSVTR